MTESGRDPHREARRAGDSPVPAPGADSNFSSPADYVLGTDGKPIRDRYGRPARRRQAERGRRGRPHPTSRRTAVHLDCPPNQGA